jgi:hypothetical protein
MASPPSSIFSKLAVSPFTANVSERVGIDPGGERWKEEVPVVIKEQWVQEGVLESMEDPAYEEELGVNSWGRSFEAFCAEEEERIDGRLQNSGGALDLDDARLLEVFSHYGSVLAAASRESRADYAGLTHRYVNLLARLATGADPAQDCYKHLKDTTTESKNTGLQDMEPGWAMLVQDSIAAARAGKPLEQSSVTAAGATIVVPAEPRNFSPGGYRQMNTMKGGEMEEQNSAVVRFVSAVPDAAGLHTAVQTDASNCAFPPMTRFTVVGVQLDAFEFDGTAALLQACARNCGEAPEPAADGAGGRPHVGRAQLLEWVGEVMPDLAEAFASEDPDERDQATEWFNDAMLPEGVESTIFTVNQTLVTVQATYLPG